MMDKIKIKLEFTSLLAISPQLNGNIIEVNTNSTVDQLLTELGIKKEHLTYIIPFINKKAVRRSAKLNNNDEIFLFLTVGGG